MISDKFDVINQVNTSNFKTSCVKKSFLHLMIINNFEFFLDTYWIKIYKSILIVSKCPNLGHAYINQQSDTYPAILELRHLPSRLGRRHREKNLTKQGRRYDFKSGWERRHFRGGLTATRRRCLDETLYVSQKIWGAEAPPTPTLPKCLSPSQGNDLNTGSLY